MTKTLFEFRWDVPIHGFRWIRAQTTGGVHAVETIAKGANTRLFLTETLQPEASVAPYRKYAPLAECTGLFRIFAQTEPTQQGILEFARLYGRLGHPQISIAPLHPPEEGQTWSAESIEHWKDAILSMRFAIRLWDLAKVGDTKGLAQYVRWFDADRVVCASHAKWWSAKPSTPLPPGERSWTISRHITVDAFDQIRTGDLIGPALYVMQFEMNQHLLNGSPRMLWNRSHTRQELCVVPSDLLSALWLQFAQSVDGNTGYKQCPECAKWFEVAPGTGRADKQYCSNTCRSRAHRHRPPAR